MTVKELIRALQELPQDRPVYIAARYTYPAPNPRLYEPERDVQYSGAHGLIDNNYCPIRSGVVIL